MLSPRRCAQLGLGAAFLVLVASVAALVSGSSDVPVAGATPAVQSLGVAPVGHVTEPLVNGIGSSERVAIAKR